MSRRTFVVQTLAHWESLSELFLKIALSTCEDNWLKVFKKMNGWNGIEASASWGRIVSLANRGAHCGRSSDLWCSLSVIGAIEVRNGCEWDLKSPLSSSLWEVMVSVCSFGGRDGRLCTSSFEYIRNFSLYKITSLKRLKRIVVYSRTNNRSLLYTYVHLPFPKYSWRNLHLCANGTVIPASSQC